MLKAKKFTAHASCHVTCRQGVKSDHIFGIPVAILPIHYTTFMGLRTIKGSLYMKILYRGVFVENFLSSFGPKFRLWGIFRGQIQIWNLLTPKRQTLA